MGLLDDSEAIRSSRVSKSRVAGQERLDAAIDRYFRDFTAGAWASGLPRQSYKGPPRIWTEHNIRWDFDVRIYLDSTKQRFVWGSFMISNKMWHWTVLPRESNRDNWTPYSADFLDTNIRDLFVQRLANRPTPIKKLFEPGDVEKALRKITLWGLVFAVGAVGLIVGLALNSKPVADSMGGWFGFLFFASFAASVTGLVNLSDWRGRLKFARQMSKLQ